MVLVVEALPVGAFLSAVPACELPRRSRFWTRCAGLLIAIVLPVLVAVFAPLGEQAAGPVLLSGVSWGMLLVALSRFVLFKGPGSEPGSGGGDDQGPGPGGDGRPTPPAPIGGIPLLDAEPSSKRVRDHGPPRWGTPPRRPVRERERVVSRLWLLGPWSSWRPV